MADRIAQFLDQFSYPPSQWLAQEVVRDRLHHASTPAATRESWKYTPLAGFVDGLDRAPIVEPLIAAADQPGISTTRLSSTSDTSLAEGPGAAGPGRFPLADIALLATGELLHLKVDRTPRQPLQVTFAEGLNVPVFIELAPGASLTLIERNPAETFSNHSLYVRVKAGASLTHARTAFTRGCCDWSLTQVELEEDADYKLQQYQCGGARRRSETHVILNGRGSQARLTGAYRVGQGTYLDQQIVVEHRAPAATSVQTFHGIADGKGSATFNGRSHIHPGTPGSNASLSNRNLALHPDAEINTKPELEIYTDDVKCGHGATIGQLSDEHLFYLRSRGLTEEAARSLLCRAFVSECFEGPLATDAAEHLLPDVAAPVGEDALAGGGAG